MNLQGIFLSTLRCFFSLWFYFRREWHSFRSWKQLPQPLHQLSPNFSISQAFAKSPSHISQTLFCLAYELLKEPTTSTGLCLHVWAPLAQLQKSTYNSCEQGWLLSWISDLVWSRPRKTHRCFSVWVISPLHFRSQPDYSSTAALAWLRGHWTAGRGREGVAEHREECRNNFIHFSHHRQQQQLHTHMTTCLKNPVLTLTWAPPSHA